MTNTFTHYSFENDSTALYNESNLSKIKATLKSATWFIRGYSTLSCPCCCCFGPQFNQGFQNVLYQYSVIFGADLRNSP